MRTDREGDREERKNSTSTFSTSFCFFLLSSKNKKIKTHSQPSNSNDFLSALPWMVCLDRSRQAVVVAVRGTVSLQDAITDIVFNPEPIDHWVPADIRGKITASAQREAERAAAECGGFAAPAAEGGGCGGGGSNASCLGHAGISRSAEAVLAAIDKLGVLPALLEGDVSALQEFHNSLDNAGKRAL